MQTKDKIIISLLVAVLVVGLYGLIGGSSAVVGGGDRTYTKLTKLWVSGATQLDGAVTATDATFTGVTKVQATASSTIIVGGVGTGGGYTMGCIKLGDSGNATATPVYITATGSTITGTTTRPAGCSAQ